jgi:SAM-dependent methyltransferase
MDLRYQRLLSGLVSYIPGVAPFYIRFVMRPKVETPSHCYGIWLKHLSIAAHHGMPLPRVVAELGPGASVDTGLAALLCGAETYYGLDVVPFAATDGVLQRFEELLHMFRARAQLPNRNGFPLLEHYLDATGFPSRLLTDEHLAITLAEPRLNRIRASIRALKAGMDTAQLDMIRYVAPWWNKPIEHAGQIDFLFSHTVLQHIDSLEAVLSSVSQLLAPGGVMSHQVNFDSHGTARRWNGQWACSPWQWRLAVGRKLFLINRQPHSRYVELLSQLRFETLADLTYQDAGGVSRAELGAEWRQLGDEDLHTRGAFFLVRSPTH